MILKVLIFAFSQRVNSSRQIAKALRENLNCLWLIGTNQADFRNINRYRGQVVKREIDEIYAAVLELLIEEDYIKLEHFFMDGTIVEANANRHEVVWAKTRKRYAERLQ
jgi:transposase